MATAVGTMVVIQVGRQMDNCMVYPFSVSVVCFWFHLNDFSNPTQGGIGPAGLSAEDLHVLDLTQQRPRWHRLDS